jgi:hypothetical protein
VNTANTKTLAKREIPNNAPTIFDPQEFTIDLANTTVITPQQMFDYLQVNDTKLVLEIAASFSAHSPTKEQIEYFLLNHRIDTHSNTTLHIVRDKRNPLVTIAQVLGPAAVIIVGLYFLVDYLNNLYSIDIGELMINSPPLATAAQLNATNGQISKLIINQNEIIQAVNDGQAAISNLRSQLLSQTFAVATWAAQMDIKTNIHFGIQVLSNFILKLGSILLGVQTGKTSPFALNLRELSELQAKVAAEYKGALLTNKLSEVRTALLNIGDILQLQYTIPISSMATQYDFYKVIPIPVFDQNRTFIPNSPFTNLAVARNGFYYASRLRFAHAFVMSFLPMYQTPVSMFVIL